MKMNIPIDVSEEEIEVLVKVAIVVGYKRENPKKAWTDKEKKEFARVALTHMLQQRLTEEYLKANPQSLLDIRSLAANRGTMRD